MFKTKKPAVDKPKIVKKKSRPMVFGLGEEKEYFIENLSVLLASGMDIIDALESIKSEVRSKVLKTIIDDLKEDIQSGVSLWLALENTKLLPAHIISLVKIGEASGRLSESLNVILVQQQKNRSFQSKIRAAMMYPVFVMGLSIIVGTGIAWFILPRLSTVFSQLNLELPLVTRLLMSFGNFLQKNGTQVIPISIIIILILFYFVFFFKHTKFIGQKILFVLPGIKKLILEVELSRLGYIMGTLLESGLPVVEALQSLSEATPLKDYQKIYHNMEISISDGRSFHEFFSTSKKIKKYIPTPVQSLIVVGENSGHLVKIFTDIGKNYDDKTEITTKNLSVILEPILLVIVWLGVVGVALAVILPIYSLIGGLSKKPQSRPIRTTNTMTTPIIISTPIIPTTSTPISTSTISPLIPTSSLPIITISTTSITSTLLITTTTIATTTPTSSPMIAVSGILEVLETGVGYLNVRSEPTSKSALVEKLIIGYNLVFDGYQDNWYHITLPDGRGGWVSDKYVKIIQ
ncbi:MAG: hypothetical protein ACD_72C00096G0001 [uncultured bacterium]|nr:MAG: hypothetical protein ACD_72C00096G0001 [uncultured bacterium]